MAEFALHSRIEITSVEIGPLFVAIDGLFQGEETDAGRLTAYIDGREAHGRRLIRPVIAADGKQVFGLRLLVPALALANITDQSIGIGLAGAGAALNSAGELTARRPGRARGYIDEVVGTEARGWVEVRNVAGENHLLPRLYLNGLLLTEIEPQHARPDVVAALEAFDEQVGFTVDLAAAARRRGARLSELADPDGKVILELRHGDVLLSRFEHAFTPRIQGNLEAAENGKIKGWVVRPPFSEEPCSLLVRVDGVEHSRITADIDRHDLIAAGLCTRGGGFEMEFVGSPSGAEATVEILVLPELAPFGGSSFRMHFPEVAVVQSAPGEPRPVTIILPVFNAAREFGECLASLFEHTSAPAHLIVVDDCSSDPAIGSILDGLADDERVRIVRNRENMGFTRSVNRGLALANREHDVVLLNSDTILTPRWLDNLRTAAYSAADIGTVTPLSDNAGAFSAPDFAQANGMPPWMTRDVYARAVTQTSAVLRPVVPTGNGFCLYIRRDCLAATGGLDEQAFPRGYGEENDFCMRAGRKGWRHLIDDRTIVFHVRSASFGAEKERLVEEASRIIADRYPEYGIHIRAFRGGALDTVRHRVRRLFHEPAREELGTARVLYVISTVTGGTPQTNEDLMRGVRDEVDTWLLRCDGKVMELSHVTDNGSRLVATHALKNRIRLTDTTNPEYDRVLLGWLVQHGFELVHVRHLAWHSLSLVSTCRQLNLPVVMSLHDFYMICPTVNLLNGEGRFCNVDCSSGEKDCEVPLWPAETVPSLRNRWIARWREMAGAVLADCDRLIVTSESSRKLFAETYPHVADRLVTIRHGRDVAAFRADLATPARHEPIRILVPGNISQAKGSKIIKALRDYDVEGRLEFHILGMADPELTGPRIVLHGPYLREDFAAHVQQIAPSFGAIFSIWPETYCHTLTEMWSAGLPVFAFDRGAVGERIAKSGGGWFVPDEDISQLRDAIIQIANDPARRRRAVQEIVAWQDTEGTTRTVAAMARDYLHVYSEVSRDRRAFHAPRLTIGLVCPASADLKSANGSTHVRVWERTRNSLFRSLRYARLRPEDLQPALEAGQLDLVLVQRNALPDRLIGTALAAMRTADVPLVLELDDNLLSTDSAVDASGCYRLGRAGLERLLLEAELVICSTEELSRALETNWQRRHVLPNGLSARLWRAPLQASAESTSLLGERAAGEIRVLFAGTATHQHDILMLEEAVRLARVVHPGLRLIIAGGFDNHSDWFEALPVPQECRNYPAYVRWLRRLGTEVDFGIAPLRASEFNASKSGLKFLEYAGCGLSALFSDAEPYRDLVQRSRTGRLIANDCRSWAEALIEAAANVDQLRVEGAVARDWVHTHAMLDLKELDELLRGFIQSRDKRAPSSSIGAAEPSGPYLSLVV